MPSHHHRHKRTSSSLQISLKLLHQWHYIGIILLLLSIITALYIKGNFLLRLWIITSIISIILIIVSLGFHHVVVSHQSQPSNFPRRTFKPFKFSSPDLYPHAIRHLRAQSAFPKEFRELLVPGHKDLSDQINALLRLIMRDFVLEWFDKISDDTAFPISVEKSIRIAIANIRERITTIDPMDIMVRKFYKLKSQIHKR